MCSNPCDKYCDGTRVKGVKFITLNVAYMTLVCPFQLVILIFRLLFIQERSEMSTIFLSVCCNPCKTVSCFR